MNLFFLFLNLGANCFGNFSPSFTALSQTKRSSRFSFIVSSGCLLDGNSPLLRMVGERCDIIIHGSGSVHGHPSKSLRAEGHAKRPSRTHESRRYSQKRRKYISRSVDEWYNEPLRKGDVVHPTLFSLRTIRWISLSGCFVTEIVCSRDLSVQAHLRHCHRTVRFEA